MAKKAKKAPVVRSGPLYDRIREILESARTSVARSVNTTQVVANWLIGREIVEEEQRGADRAEYGTELLKVLSSQLNQQFGRGFSVSALQYMRSFFLTYPKLLEKQHALRVEFSAPDSAAEKQHALRGKSADSPLLQKTHAVRAELADANDQSWQPSQLLS